MVARSLAPFRHRGFRLVWAGALVSNIGTWMETTALAYYVADTSSASASGLVAAAGFVPTALLGPLGGAWADRFDRRRVVALANAVFALVAAGVALLVSSGHATAGNLALLSLLGGCASAISWPSFQAMLPDLVPPADLVGAIGLASTQWNLGRILGPSAAAIAIAIGGVPTALWVNVASFVGVIAAVLLAPVPRRAPVRRSVRVAVRDSLEFVRVTPPVRAMLPLMALVVFFGSPFMGLTAQMATNVFGSDQDGTSLLVTAQGIGAVLAGASMGSLVARFGTRRTLQWASMMMVPVLVAYGLAPTLWSAVPLVLLAGAGYMVTLSTCTNITQRSASAEQRGRAMIVNNFLLGAAYPLGVYLQGELADRYSLRTVTAAGGVGLGLSLLAMRLVRPGLTEPIARLDLPVDTQETADVH
jgi:MFS family permease